MYTPAFAKALYQWKAEQNNPGSAFSGPDSVFNLNVTKNGQTQPWDNSMYRSDPGDPTMGGQQAQGRLGMGSLFKDDMNGRDLGGGMNDFLSRGQGLGGIDRAIGGARPGATGGFSYFFD